MSKSHPRLVECFHRQRGRCIWCGCTMFISNEEKRVYAPCRATLDHAYNKLSTLRHKYGNKVFAACYACNSIRGSFDLMLFERGVDISDIWIFPSVERLHA